MRFFSLPIGIWAISLLVTSAAAAPADAKPKAKKPKKPPAEPVGLQLTLQDFNSTIEHDFWFVEFYSPSCPHCRKFAPTWKEFTKGQEGVPKLKFAQVNCLAQGDLCNAHGVKGYPELNLFQNGTRIGQFDDERLIPKMTTWVKDQMVKFDVPPEPTSVVSSSSSSSSSSSPAEPTPAALVEQAKNEHEQYQALVHDHDHDGHDHHKHDHQAEEDAVLPAVRSIVNPSGTVLSLEAGTFATALAEGPLFVKFFAPWCGHCKKLAPTWIKIAEKMQGKLTIAEVNCDTFKNLCVQQGVDGYPQMFFYSGGKKMEYSGPRSYEALERYAQKAAAPAVETIQHPAFKKLLKDEDVFMVYVHQSEDKTYESLVEEASKPLVGSPPVYKSSDVRIPQMYTLIQPPSLLVFKSGELTAKLHLGDIPTKPEKLTQWMLEKRLPLALELSPDNFQDVMKSPARPLVVLAAYNPAAPDAGRVEEGVKAFADTWRVEHPRAAREVVHVWMDGVKWKEWLKSMYGLSGTLPKVVIVDHARLTYYDTDAKGEAIEFDASSVQRALADALSGASSAKHSENILERGVRLVTDSIDASFVAVQNNILISLVGFGALVVVAAAGFKRVLRVDPNVYVPHHAARLD